MTVKEAEMTLTMTRTIYVVELYDDPRNPNRVTELLYYGDDLRRADSILKDGRAKHPEVINHRPVVRIRTEFVTTAG